MMGTQTVEAQLFHEFDLDAHVPPNHMQREIDRFLDMGDMRERLKPFYSHTGRPSIAPELIVRMLVIGYVMGICSRTTPLPRGASQPGVSLVLSSRAG